MFDYYALPDDWPGRKQSRKLSWNKRASHVEKEIHKDICRAIGNSFQPEFFIAYVQLHEFEALAFADVEKLASVVAPLANRSAESLAGSFQEIRDEAGDPEAINDNYETCPSRRIGKIVNAYKKRVQGPIVTGRIGLDVLREQCRHFSDWLMRLEKLGGATH